MCKENSFCRPKKGHPKQATGHFIVSDPMRGRGAFTDPVHLRILEPFVDPVHQRILEPFLDPVHQKVQEPFLDPASPRLPEYRWSACLPGIPSPLSLNITVHIAKQNLKNKTASFADYMEYTWIGTSSRHPLFNQWSWNQWDATLVGLPRSFNIAEGWHNGFKSLIGCSHPAPYHLEVLGVAEVGARHHRHEVL